MVQVRISEVSSEVTVVKTDKVLILFVCKKIGEIYFFFTRMHVKIKINGSRRGRRKQSSL